MYEMRSSQFFRSGSPDNPPGPPGTLVRSVTLLPGLAVSMVAFTAGGSIEAVAVNDHDDIHFSCMFEGEVEVSFGARAVVLQPGSLVTSFAPGERFLLRIPRQYRNIEVTVQPDCLSGLAGGDFDRIGEDLRRGRCLYQTRSNRAARDAAIRLGRLMDDERGSRLRLHAAALDYLACHLEGYRGDDGGGALPARERRQVEAARALLLRDLGRAPTIAELARETGLNQLKLKRGFRVLYGTSIYALFQRERMERARHLLSRHGVTETAMMLGYSNISHFSAAFRKQFGLLPREVRRGGAG